MENIRWLKKSKYNEIIDLYEQIKRVAHEVLKEYFGKIKLNEYYDSAKYH